MNNAEMINIAEELIKKNNFNQAENIYLKILEANPGDAYALSKLGLINIYKSDFKNAENFLELALKIGHDLETLKKLAFVKERLFQYYDAIVMYEQIIELEPNEAYYDIVQNLYNKVELYDNEIEIAKKRVEQYGSVDAYTRLFNLYISIGRAEELKELKSEIEKKFPNKAFVYDLFGIYEEFIEEDLDAAETFYNKSIKMGLKNAAYDLAVCYRKHHKYLEAEKCCRKILKDYPDQESILYTYASIFFTEKRMHQGYKYYLQRGKLPQHKNLKNPWDGKAHPKDILLVMAEQGYGDSLMMARYFQFLTDKFETVKVAVPETLVDLFSTNFEQIKNSNIEIMPSSDVYSTVYNWSVLMMDLPYRLNMTFHNIPESKGYLSCSELKYDYFKNKYFENKKLKVGLCWRAKGEGFRVALQRTIDINYYLKDLFDIENVEYYSLQKDDIFDVKNNFPQIVDLSGDLDSFEDTAAALKNLDLFISIDSAPAHLAGALGVKTLLLLPFCPEWRWFDNDKKTEWYSNMEIFKQKVGENWSSATIPLIERVKEIAEKKR